MIQYLVAFCAFILTGTACSKQPGAPAAAPAIGSYQPPNDSNKVATYLALGDSYTIGQGVPAQDRFPAQLVSTLRQQGIAIEQPVYIATTGWTTGVLLSALAQQKPATDYDIVTLLIGVNDQYQGVDTTTYAQRFSQLLDAAIRYANNRRNRVFVLSIPDYSATPFVGRNDKERVSREIDVFNSINKRITNQNLITYINITPSTREAASNPGLIAGDGLHPSGQEYKKWVAMLSPLVKAAL